MLKYILYILLAIAVLALIAGGIHLYRVSARNKAEMAQFAGPKIGYHNTLGKTLVIYYSLSGHTKDHGWIRSDLPKSLWRLAGPCLSA